MIWVKSKDKDEKVGEVEEKEVALAERVSKNETLLASHVNIFQ